MSQSNTAQELVNGVVELVSLPEVCLRINEMLDDENTTAEEFGEVISLDTGLTARLLKIVNSPIYGFPNRVDTVSRAVMLLGLQELRSLVIAASAIDVFANLPVHPLNKTTFWRHCMYTGVFARLLAKQCNVLHSERLFIAGMLHDIGKMILCHRLPETMAEIEVKARASALAETEVEQQVLGYTHAAAGAELLRKWNLPVTLCDTVAHHHDPLQAEYSQFDACLLFLANQMAEESKLVTGASHPRYAQNISPTIWSMTSLNPDILAGIESKAMPEFIEAIEAILPRNYLF